MGKEVTSACVMKHDRSPAVIRVRECGYRVLILRRSAPASGSTPWQEAHLILTPLSIYIGYRPMRMLCRLRRVHAQPRRHRAAPRPPTRVRTGLCLKRGRLRERQLRVPLVAFTRRAQLQYLAEQFIAVSAFRRMCFFNKPEGCFMTPLTQAFLKGKGTLKGFLKFCQRLGYSTIKSFV